MFRTRLRPRWASALALFIACAGVTYAPTEATASEAEVPSKEAAVAAAMTVLDDFMRAFNNRDMSGWAATLHYPHVRFASGSVRVWADRAEFESVSPFNSLAALTWDHSHWISRDVVLASSGKVHIATVFERFDANNRSLGRYESLYIVTRKSTSSGSRWGIQARSSLAP